jgi:hypothetical protein
VHPANAMLTLTERSALGMGVPGYEMSGRSVGPLRRRDDRCAADLKIASSGSLNCIALASRRAESG